jgi:outer membrane biosynthesis protein TonB
VPRCLQNRTRVRMPSTEHHRMDPGLEWRLKVALNRITPPAATPRYLSKSMHRIRPLRIAPVALAAATAILFALTATATTGSPNPAVWTGDAASTIGAVGHVVEPSPNPQPSPAPPPPPAPPRKAVVPPPVSARPPEQKASPRPEPSEHPEESPRPWPTPSPSPSGDHSGQGWPSPWPSQWPSPSPGAGDH